MPTNFRVPQLLDAEIGPWTLVPREFNEDRRRRWQVLTHQIVDAHIPEYEPGFCSGHDGEPLWWEVFLNGRQIGDVILYDIDFVDMDGDNVQVRCGISPALEGMELPPPRNRVVIAQLQVLMLSLLREVLPFSGLAGGLDIVEFTFPGSDQGKARWPVDTVPALAAPDMEQEDVADDEVPGRRIMKRLRRRP